MSAFPRTSSPPGSLELSPARARAARRSREGGGIIFIVAMTLAVLAALGVYALQASSIEIKMAGYERQSAQTHYLAEYGVLAAADNMGPDLFPAVWQLMKTARDTSCVSIPTVPSTMTAAVNANPLALACRRMGSTELALAWSQTTPLQATALGATRTQGDFFVELTEPSNSVPPVGFDNQSGFCFKQIIVTSVGMTQPNLGTTPPTGANPYAGEGLEMARARVIGGPLRDGCPH